MTHKNSDTLWINKYKPAKLSELIGIQSQITKIKSWLNNLQETKSQSLVISGNQGLGKTLTIKLILEEYNYIVRIINPNEIKDHRSFDDFNDYYNFVDSIYSKINFKDNKNKKIALIFDETENITLTSEKKYIMDIHKENNKSKSFPLIFISNNQHSKLLNDLKKNCMEIIFTKPKISEIRDHILKILQEENIKIKDSNILDKLIIFSQYDIRRLINLLQELSYHIKNNIIMDKNIDEFINKSREKNIEIGLFESTSNILNNNLDYETIMKYYYDEKVLQPLMIHENYPKRLLSNNDNKWSETINDIVSISDSLSRGDNIETSIYTDQNWYLQNIHGFFACINTSYIINKNNKTKQIDTSDIKFSSDLNKTSLKNINRKNIVNLIKIINNKSNHEILIINKLCNYLIENGREMELINILNGYNKNISIKEIELCLKIDKTTEFNMLGSKDKKRITKQMK
jgi:DNA polymerase III delta prime subunit